MAAAAALALSLLASCGVSPHHTLDGTSAASQISSGLSKSYPGTSPEVSCPSGVPVRAGRTFVCQITLDGQPLTVTGTFKSSKGDFRLTPSAAIIPVKETETALESSIQKQTPLPVTVTCGSRTVEVVPAGGTFSCTATARGQEPRPVTVTVHDLNGSYTYSLGAPVNPGGTGANQTPP